MTKKELKINQKLATYGAIDDVTVSVNNSQISQTRRGKWESGGIMGKAVQTDVSKTFENLEKFKVFINLYILIPCTCKVHVR